MITQTVPIDQIRPYENNPRDNTPSISKVAESIRSFGFLQPIVCDTEGVILAGHTRYQAALQLGLKEIPVLFARGLTPAQARAYRLADNKVGEGSLWLDDLLTAEWDAVMAESPELLPADFGFDLSTEARQWKSWENAGKRCDLTKKITLRTKGGFYLTTFFNTSKKGRTLESIKSDPSLVPVFADNLCDYLRQCFGGSLAQGDWCLCTTPSRRHKGGFHFSTEICRTASASLGIPFYADVVAAHNRDRVHTDFTLECDPKEHNIILYDDIITTGVTLRDTRDLLVQAGHVVFPIVAIRNQ